MTATTAMMQQFNQLDSDDDLDVGQVGNAGTNGVDDAIYRSR